MEKVKKTDLDKIVDVNSLDEYIKNLEHVGFQSSQLGIARNILLKMKNEKCTIFLSFTANLIASGMRGIITKIISSGIIDAVVTTGGAIDHDIIKCVLPYEVGTFNIDDNELFQKGINRIGNIFVKNDRYEKLEYISNQVLKTAINKSGNLLSQTELISYYQEWLVENTNTFAQKNSFLVACKKNDVPVFCPGLIDSAIGLNIYFFKQTRFGKDFVLDVSRDLKLLADIVLNADKTGALVLGGGIAKHHVIGANILRGGLDYAIYVTSASEYDGSLSGAKTNEGISWGKVKQKKSLYNHCTVHGEATLILPLLIEGII